MDPHENPTTIFQDIMSEGGFWSLLHFLFGGGMTWSPMIPALQAFGTQKITFEDSWGTLNVGQEEVSLMII